MRPTLELVSEVLDPHSPDLFYINLVAKQQISANQGPNSRFDLKAYTTALMSKSNSN